MGQTLIGYDTAHTITASAISTEGRGFKVGNRRSDNAGGDWVFVQASNSVTAGDAVRIQANYKIGQLTIDTAKQDVEVGFAQIAFADGEYGWVMTQGRPNVRLAADCEPSVSLYATATGGIVDDATTSAMIQGLIASTSVTGATVVASCVAQFPTLVRGVVLGAV